MRRNPFDDLEQLFDRVESEFEGRSVLGGGAVPVDVLEADEAYVVRADLPGFDAADLELTFADGRLHLAAEREEETEAADESAYLRKERRREVERTVVLPGEVDADGIEADYDGGVLTVRLPLAEPDESGHRIEIE